MERLRWTIVILSALSSACSEQEPPECNDCRSYHHDPLLAKKVALDTGLPICAEASIFQSSSVAMEHDPSMPEYEVQVVMETYCAQPLIEQVERRLDRKSMQTLYEAPNGNHITLSALAYSGYEISVRKPPKRDGS